MSLGDITRQAVLQAIADNERPNDLLRKYGFGRSKRYHVKIDGDLYDSKALMSVAHSYLGPENRPLHNTEFKGGLRDVVKRLQELGFEVIDDSTKKQKKPKNPDWSRDELILALDLYFSREDQNIKKDSPEVQALSELLMQLAEARRLSVYKTFRNVNGVYMKVMNFRRFDNRFSADGRSGLPHGNADEEVVWKKFSGDREQLRVIAEMIRAGLKDSEVRRDLAIEYDDIDEAEEGRVATVLHKRRERNKRLARKRKQTALERDGHLRCECCSFDFRTTYGKHGDGFIEVHHIVPVHTLKVGHKTKLAELALICANCHRMIHRKRPWLSLNELKTLMPRD